MKSSLLRKLKSDKRQTVHVVVVGTKPDIIKQASIYHELVRRGELVIICHTGQHYDYRNSKAVFREFNLPCHVNFKVRGDLNRKLGTIICKTGRLMSELKQLGKIVVPYVHGDTLTACGFAIGATMEGVAPVHVEAGLRTMTIKRGVIRKFLEDVKNSTFDYYDYVRSMKTFSNYELGSFEPFPEQIDTRIIDVISAIRFAPVEMNANNLKLERNLKSGIVIVGNTISDAVAHTLGDNDTYRDTHFGHKENDIFFTIHRRENCTNRERVIKIINLLRMLAEDNKKIVVVMHPMFKMSIKKYCNDDFDVLCEKFKNNVRIVEPIAKYADALRMICSSKIIVTDSGGLQEEANMLNKRCVILRYGTDRLESVLYGSNIVTPIIDTDFMFKIVIGTLNDADGDSRKKYTLYGDNVAKKIVSYVLDHIDAESGLFMSEERRLAKNV